MIVGLGMDLVDVDRMRGLYARWGEHRLGRIFTGPELAYCLEQVDPGPSLAARFAAKEAFYKAVGTGWGRAGALNEVEVRRTAGGTPELRVTGRAARRVEEGIRMHLSLSHSATVAGAVVVLES
jgi:holo-[acyl-carrier protein] synthase